MRVLLLFLAILGVGTIAEAQFYNKVQPYSESTQYYYKHHSPNIYSHSTLPYKQDHYYYDPQPQVYWDPILFNQNQTIRQYLRAMGQDENSYENIIPCGNVCTDEIYRSQFLTNQRVINDLQQQYNYYLHSNKKANEAREYYENAQKEMQNNNEDNIIDDNGNILFENFGANTNTSSENNEQSEPLYYQKHYKYQKGLLFKIPNDEPSVFKPNYKFENGKLIKID